MKLTYRGISYNYNPPQIETTQGQTVGKYRGQDWRFRNLEKPPVLQPSHNLTYRGVQYTNNPVKVVKPVTVPHSVAEKSRVLMMNQERSTLKREQSMLTRLAEEVGLKQVTKSYHHV